MEDQYIAVGCFGKVGCWEEHWEENVSTPSVHALKQWVEAGREETGSVESARVRFLFGLPDSPEVIAGVIRPSQDKKSRRFPFAVTAQLPRRSYGRSYALLPLALSSVWEGLDDAWESLAGVATKSSFREVLESTLVPSPAPLRLVQSRYKEMQADPAGKIFDRGDGASPQNLERNFPGFLSRLRSDGSGEGMIAEIPVSSDLGQASFETAFWMDLINRQFLLRRFEPSIFLEETAGRQDRTVFLVFGKLNPSDYALLMSGAPARDQVARPAHGGGAGAPSENPWTDLAFGDLLKRRFRGGGSETESEQASKSP